MVEGAGRISYGKHRPLAAHTSRSRSVLAWPSARSGFAPLAGHSGDFRHEPAVAQRLILVERKASVDSERLIETDAKQCTVGAVSVIVVRAEREEYRQRRQ